MRSRNELYRRTMDEPVSFRNLWPKLVCWWNHSSRKAEDNYLKASMRQYRRAQNKYAVFMQRAMRSTTVIAKAQEEIYRLNEIIRIHQESHDSLQQRLRTINDAVQSIDVSLECLRNHSRAPMERLDGHPTATEL